MEDLRYTPGVVEEDYRCPSFHKIDFLYFFISGVQVRLHVRVMRDEIEHPVELIARLVQNLGETMPSGTPRLRKTFLDFLF
jgi:hypothetical protein